MGQNRFMNKAACYEAAFIAMISENREELLFIFRIIIFIKIFEVSNITIELLHI